MIAIDLAAGVFAMIVGLLVVACVITCIWAQLTLQRCLKILDFVSGQLVKEGGETNDRP